MQKKKMLSMFLVLVMALTVQMPVCAEEISAMDSVEEVETAIISDSEEVIAEEESMITNEEDVTMEVVEAEPEAEISLAEEPQEDVSAEITRESAASAANTVTYRTHVQTYGWQNFVSNGAMSGTSGQSKRLEGIEIKLENAAYTGSIQYRTHVQTYGWQNWKQDGAMSGTSGQAKRLEAIQIQLTGAMATHYDVYYRVHAQTFGWMGWAKNGESAGTAGYSKRLEGIEIRLVTKGGSAPGSTQNAYRHPLIQYKTHVQTYGWQGWKQDGAMSGTSGQAKRLEGINIALCNQDYTGSVRYRTHVQTYGWQNYVTDGAMSGTSGKAKRLEAIQIELTGEMANHYDIYYRVHAQTFGWMGWAKNGAQAGTAGYGKRLEGIEIRLVAKNGSAPGSTENSYKEITSGGNSTNSSTGNTAHSHTWVSNSGHAIRCNKHQDMLFATGRDRDLHNAETSCYGGYSVISVSGRKCSICGQFEFTRHVHDLGAVDVKIVEKAIKCKCGVTCRAYDNYTAKQDWNDHSLQALTSGKYSEHNTFSETTADSYLTIPTKKCSCGWLYGSFTKEWNLYKQITSGTREVVDIIIDGKGGYTIDDVIKMSAK